MRSHSPIDGSLLLRLARETLNEHFGLGSYSTPQESYLQEPGATFVTLKMHHVLRGCIGSLEARRSLLNDLRENALAAAFRDPRFPPLTEDELTEVQLEVSLLSPLEPLNIQSEEEALNCICPGQDGLLLECDGRKGTFLPQVWEQLPDPQDFLRHLKMKAGLSPMGWDRDYQLFRYSVSHWSEPS